MSAASVQQCQFYEDTSVISGSDRYILLATDQQPAIFYVKGTLTHLIVTAAGGVKNRKLHAKVDEYTARLKIENEKDHRITSEGFEAVVKLLKDTKSACQNIALSSGLVESRKLFRLKEMTVKVSNFNSNVVYFNRKGARKNKLQQDDVSSPDFLQVFPKQGEDYPVLRYPNGWFLNPLTPVTDDQAIDVKAEEIELLCSATVYFEIRQGCYNFEGHDGHVKQIVLITSETAIKVHPPAPVEMGIVQRAKRRSLSF